MDGDSIYESNIVKRFLDEVTDKPKPENPRDRAYARIRMAFAERRP